MFGDDSPFFEVLGFPINEFITIIFILIGIHHVGTTVSRSLPKIPKEKIYDSVLFFTPLFLFAISQFLFIFLEISSKYVFEFNILNGLVFSKLAFEEIISIISKVFINIKFRVNMFSFISKHLSI